MVPTKIHPDLPAEDLIAHCLSPDAEFIEGTEKYANRVVKIGDHAVMKFGPLVTKFEFENLKIAKSLVDPNIVYVPEVYRFLSDIDHDDFGRERGYILMEYVHGRTIDPLEDSDRVQRIAEIVAHLASIRGELPGTLSRGPARGIIFPEHHGDFVFDDVQALEDFFNKRLLPGNNLKLDLKGTELVLCHLDIAPRNILWREDGSICFLDWVSAGFYPRSFEFAALRYLLGFEGDFKPMLLDAIMPQPTQDEQDQSTAVMVARGNSEWCTFRPPAPRPSRHRISGYTPVHMDPSLTPMPPLTTVDSAVNSIYPDYPHNMPPFPPPPPVIPMPVDPGPCPPDLVFVTTEDYDHLVYTPWGFVAHPDAKPLKGSRFYKK